MERLDVEDFDEEKRAVRELNTYLAALDILGARDVEDNQKLKQRFNQKLSDIQSDDIGECFLELNMCLKEHVENQLADAYEIAISYRAKHYIESDTQKLRILSPKEIYFDKVSELTDVELIQGMIELLESGYGDFKLNKILLNRYGNDPVKAIEVLSGKFPETLKNILREAYNV